MEEEEAAGGRRILSILRELAGMLVDGRDEPVDAEFARAGVSVERVARISGIQALLLPVLTVPLLILVPPTDGIGEVGWLFAGLVILAVVALGAHLTTTPEPRAKILALSNLVTASVLALLVALTGGPDSAYPFIFPLLAANISPHPPRTRRALILWLFAMAALPLIYTEDVSAADWAKVAMVCIASVATLLTLVWLSNRVRRSETGLMDAVTSAQVAREALQVEAEKLLEIGEAREQLVSRVSHELRTPLTSAKGYLEALMAGEGGELQADQRELAEVALRNTVRLELLIADLLLLSHVEAGQLELRPHRVRIAESLKRLAEELRQVARDRRVQLIVEVPPELEWTVDRARLEQAVTNLISNAIKYSEEGLPVLVRASEGERGLVIEVLDKGVGIPRDEVARLGERFFRASTAGIAQGTGLGIAITRELVELHGGTLEAESEEGAGSIFRIRIPRSPEQP